MRLRPGLRQVALAVMAVQVQPDLPELSAVGCNSATEGSSTSKLKEMAKAIRTQSPRRLLSEAYGSCPQGGLLH
jgi:hypothetical protein